MILLINERFFVSFQCLCLPSRFSIQKLDQSGQVGLDNVGNPKMTDPISVKLQVSNRANISDHKEGKYLGEDMSFFHRVSDIGYDVWMDTSIELQHIGSHVFGK